MILIEEIEAMTEMIVGTTEEEMTVETIGIGEAEGKTTEEERIQETGEMKEEIGSFI